MLHYEFRVAVTTSHQESLQVTFWAGSSGQEVAHDDSEMTGHVDL